MTGARRIVVGLAAARLLSGCTAGTVPAKERSERKAPAHRPVVC